MTEPEPACAGSERHPQVSKVVVALQDPGPERTSLQRTAGPASGPCEPAGGRTAGQPPPRPARGRNGFQPARGGLHRPGRRPRTSCGCIRDEPNNSGRRSPHSHPEPPGRPRRSMDPAWAAADPCRRGTPGDRRRRSAPRRRSCPARRRGRSSASLRISRPTIRVSGLKSTGRRRVASSSAISSHTVIRSLWTSLSHPGRSGPSPHSASVRMVASRWRTPDCFAQSHTSRMRPLPSTQWTVSRSPRRFARRTTACSALQAGLRRSE